MKGIFFNLIESIIGHARLVVALTAAVTVVLGFFALRLQVDPDTASLIPESPEVIRLQEKYGTESSSTDFLVILARSPDIFSVRALSLLDGACAQIGKIPTVHEGITPFNFMTFAKEGSRLAFAPMAAGQKAPSTDAEVKAFRQKILADPQARNLVVSADGTTLCALFPVDIADEYSAVLTATEAIIEPLKETMDIRITGGLPYNRAIIDNLYGDLPIFLGIGLLIILVSYYLSFRTRRSMILPALVVVLGTTWTMGAMSLLGFKLTMVNIMTPPLVLILGSSYSLHMLNQYYREARTSGPAQRGDTRWIADSVGHITTTIALASITTVFGFCSLLSASLRQLREFGVSTSLGILFTAALSVFFLPAALSMLRPPTAIQRDRALEGPVTRLMGSLARLVIRFRAAIIVAVVLVAAGFALTIGSVRYETDFTRYFRKAEKAVEDNQVLVETMGGFTSINFSLNAPAGRQSYFLSPEVLRQVAAFEDRLRLDKDIAYISSFTAYLRSMNRTMTGSDEVPDTRPLILLLSRYFAALAETPMGRNVTGILMNRDLTRLTFVLRVYDSERGNIAFEESLGKTMDRVRVAAAETLPGEVTPEFWGATISVLYLSEFLTRNQVTSIFLSAVLVFLVSALVFRSAKLGLFVIAPLATGIMSNFIVMAILQIPLDVVTITFTSIAIGIGVDNAIHLTIQYRRQSRIYTDDPDKTIEHTLKVAGRPMILTTLSIMSALLVLVFSSFMPIVYFGILISLSLALTTAGALVFLPVLLHADAKGKARKRKAAVASST